jgi:S1-C subfamily serine protease
MPRSLIGLVAVLLLATSSWGQAIDKQVLDQLKDSTVFIKLKIPQVGEASGSGFVIRAAGDSVLIMTNRHVVVLDEDDLPSSAKGAARELWVVFRSGTPQQLELPATLLAYDDREVRDLAVLEVKGVKSPPRPIPANLTTAEADFYETMPVYTLGFPGGRAVGGVVGNVKNNPAITVNTMSISSFRRDDANRLARVQLNGSAIEGNSGGPLVDAKGRLVGVIVSRLRGEPVGFAIPPSVISQFLDGDLGALKAELTSLQSGTAAVKLEVKLIDPLRNLKAVTLRYARQSGTPAPAAPDARGSYPLILNGTNVALQVSGAVAAGQFSLPVARPEDRKLLAQFALTMANGRIMAAKPTPIDIPDSPGAIAGMDRDDRPRAVPRWSCEVNVVEGVKIKHHAGGTTIELPGGTPLVNAPQAKLFTAPGALVQVQGEFVAVVEVTNDFDPGGQTVSLPSGRRFPFTFQGAGLLLWQDEKNFIRLERCKGSDGSVSLIHRVLVEIYKDGREVGLYYSKPIPEKPVVLAARRKGTTVQLLFGEPPDKMTIFRELALDFNPSILVGVSASNLSRQPLTAKFDKFTLQGPGGQEVAVRPVSMTRLVSTGSDRRSDGSLVLEGAALKVLKTTGAAPEAQSMSQYKGKWSEDRQLLWRPLSQGEAITLEVPVDTPGKFELKAKFTMAPDYGRINLAMDARPLYQGRPLDFYYKEVRPAKLMSLGTVSLDKGRHRLTITVQDKNPKSLGYSMGLDEIQIVPVKK